MEHSLGQMALVKFNVDVGYWLSADESVSSSDPRAANSASPFLLFIIEDSKTASVLVLLCGQSIHYSDVCHDADQQCFLLFPFGWVTYFFKSLARFHIVAQTNINVQTGLSFMGGCVAVCISLVFRILLSQSDGYI